MMSRITLATCRQYDECPERLDFGLTVCGSCDAERVDLCNHCGEEITSSGSYWRCGCGKWLKSWYERDER
jgi:hypothetical protein